MTTSRFQVSPPLSSAVRQRRDLTTLALSILEDRGYQEIEVPLLAPYDELRSALGPEISAQLFRFVDRDGDLLVLRGDLTPLVARQLAGRMPHQPGPVRVCYASRVARVRRAFAREQVEANELGFELMGEAGLEADLEVIGCALALAERLGFVGCELALGDVRIAAGLTDEAVKAGAPRVAVERAVARRDPVAVVQACAQSETPVALRAALARACTLDPSLEDLARIEAAAPEALHAGASALRARVQALVDAGHQDLVALDLGAQDDRGYYTGARFTLRHEDIDTPLGRGGRYDDLRAHFGPPGPAVGFAFGVDTLVGAREAQVQS